MLATVVALAAATRLPGLVTRGRFDGDQGHDMLVLLQFTRDGVFPLLGPPTSIGDFHHGAFYYLLLAPMAWLSNSDPFAVVTAIALMGAAAVGLTWWLARSIGGPLAGFVAGVLLAISPAGIDESTFIWNPNPIPLFAAIALATAWRAHTTGHARWWVAALASAGAVFQLHVLGVVFLPPLLVFLGLEIRAASRRGDAAAARRLARAGVAGMAAIALLFVPLAIHELATGFSETNRVIAYVTSGGGGGGSLGPIGALFFTLFRVVGWPFVDLVTDSPIGAVVAVSIAVALGAWRLVTARGEEAVAVRWLVATALWGVAALSVLAPSLQTVVVGLPNDHYHAFLDPVIVVVVAVAGAGMAGRAAQASREGARIAARALLMAAFAGVVVLGISRWPAPIDPNGGWPAAEASGPRILATTGTVPVDVVALPTVKTPDGTGFPIVYAGGTLTDDPWSAGFIVVACDRLFESLIGSPCAGPAEDRRMQDLAAGGARRLPALVTRFDASARISISIYRP